LPEHDVERFRVRRRFYESIIGAYDKFMPKVENMIDGIKKSEEQSKERLESLEKQVQVLEESRLALKNI